MAGRHVATVAVTVALLGLLLLYAAFPIDVQASKATRPLAPPPTIDGDSASSDLATAKATLVSQTTTADESMQLTVAPDWWRTVHHDVFQPPVNESDPSTVATCLSRAVTGADSRGGFVGVAACDNPSPRRDWLTTLPIDAARHALFAHCGGNDKECTTFLPNGIEVLKIARFGKRRIKVGRVTNEFSVLLGYQMIRASRRFESNTFAYVAPDFMWWESRAPAPSAFRSPLIPPVWAPRELPTVDYDVAVWLPTLTTCLNNLYHGTFEYVLPLWHLLSAVVSLNATRWPAMRVVVFIPLIRLENWGRYNSRCRVLNEAPYGFGPPAVTSFMLSAMRQTMQRLDFVAVNEDWKTWRAGEGRQEMNATFRASELFRGLPSSCFSYARSMEQMMTVGLDEYPYVKRNQVCDAILRSFALTVLRAHNIDDGDAPVTAEESRCPRIVLISRGLRKNGRDFIDRASVVEALKSAISRAKDCGSFREIALEKYSIVEQLQLMRNTTVLVGARGAGLVMGLFLRRGAAVLSLSPYRPKVPVIFDDATEPWVPWGFIRDDFHVSAGLCPMQNSHHANALHQQMCATSSTNYCQMLCDHDYVRDLMEVLLMRVEIGATLRHHAAFATTWLETLGTSYLVPHVTMIQTTVAWRDSALAACGMGNFQATPYSAAEPELPRNIKWLFAKYDAAALVEQVFGGALLNGATDEVLTFVQMDQREGVRRGEAYTFNRWAIRNRKPFQRKPATQEERLLRLADGPNPAFSTSLLSRPVKIRLLQQLAALNRTR